MTFRGFTFAKSMAWIQGNFVAARRCVDSVGAANEGHAAELGVFLQATLRCVSTETGRIWSGHAPSNLRLFSPTSCSSVTVNLGFSASRRVVSHRTAQHRHMSLTICCFFLLLFGSCLRFGPYFVEPIVAGLKSDKKPFISAFDLIGAPVVTDDFVVGGTCTNNLYGMCESLYRPNMVSEMRHECRTTIYLYFFNNLAGSLC